MKNGYCHIVFMLVFLLFFNSIKCGFMLGFYLADTKSFVELFCVNKDKPELKCNGKCELSKLAQKESKNDKPSYLDFLNRELVFHYNLKTYYPTALNFKKEKVNNFFYSANYNFRSSEIVTPPPKFII